MIFLVPVTLSSTISFSLLVTKMHRVIPFVVSIRASHDVSNTIALCCRKRGQQNQQKRKGRDPLKVFRIGKYVLLPSIASRLFRFLSGMPSAMLFFSPSFYCVRKSFKPAQGHQLLRGPRPFNWRAQLPHTLAVSMTGASESALSALRISSPGLPTSGRSPPSAVGARATSRDPSARPPRK